MLWEYDFPKGPRLRNFVAKKNILLIFILGVLACQNAWATPEEIPHKKFEWGAGFLNILANHYRGSDQHKLWVFPIPYFTYKSEKLEAEPSFVRGIFFHNEWFSFKLSLMLGLNVESEKNRARAGMPSLDYTFEIGPMFVFQIWKSQNQDMLVRFEWPIRESLATNLHYVKPVGLFTVPYVNFIHNPTPETWNWSSEFSVSPMFADQKYHQYFYGVDTPYVRADRPFFKAHGGYNGLQTALVLNKRMENFVIIPFFRWDFLRGAAFQESPLVKTKQYGLIGLGVFWLFH